MAAIAGPYGLRIVKMLGDLPFSGGMHTIPLLTNVTSGFFFGDPVGLIGGQPAPIAASPTPTLGANSPIGIFMGAEYQDPIRGFVNSQFLPANIISSGATKVKLKIFDAPNIVMQVQANGPVALNQIGLNAPLVIAAGSTVTGDSTVALNAGAIAAGALAVRIYGFVVNASPSPGASSTPGDAFTDTLVIWNFGVHRYQNSGGQ
jgi:hypothetical protein